MNYRVRITEEAAVLFMKYGIRAVTMDSIANHLGMSKRTIYEHFADKDELLVSVINNMAKKQKDVFRKIMDDADNVIEALFEMLRVASLHFSNTNPTYFMDLKKYHYKVYEMICQKGDIKNYEMSLAMLRRGIEEKIFRDDINIEIVNTGIHSAIDAIRDNEDLLPEKYSSFEIVDNLLFNFLLGIATPEGQQLINKYKEQKKIELNA
ncbi:MAG: TetR/AcrR family transcriptional regulator [Bacteroidales bacterium]|nr:TetR/AcrR family transcriptional regulator [Bacteroidales bacterium]